MGKYRGPGYRRANKTYELVFTGQYEGLEISAKGLPLGKFLAMAKLLDIDMVAPTEQDMAKLDELFSRFAATLIDWNLEDEEGVALPANLETLYTLDIDMVMMLIVTYMDAISGVAAPLEKPQSSGDKSAEASIPMATL